MTQKILAIKFKVLKTRSTSSRILNSNTFMNCYLVSFGLVFVRKFSAIGADTPIRSAGWAGVQDGQQWARAGCGLGSKRLDSWGSFLPLFYGGLLLNRCWFLNLGLLDGNWLRLLGSGGLLGSSLLGSLDLTENIL